MDRTGNKLHKGFCLLMLLILVTQLDIFSQTLRIEKFSPVNLDLTSRVAPVKDNNNIPCALVKILCNDIITDVQGNVVRLEEYGNEYWVYLSAGSKSLKILTLHHKPLELRINDYLNGGVSSQSTYQLYLESDLPPEVLFGSSNPLAPIIMAKKGDPILPYWWNTNEKGLYVGISVPTLDGETAKLMAIANAIYSFVHYSGCRKVYYDAEIEEVDDKGKYMALCEGIEMGFSIRIVQEYYNSNGEYFVLCAIEKGESSNELQTRWFFDSEGPESTLSVELGIKARVNRYPIDIALVYKIVSSKTSSHCSIVCNGKNLIEIDNVGLKDNIADFILDGSIGLSQLRLLSAIPLMPDNFRCSGGMSLLSERNSVSYSSHLFINGSGQSSSHEIRLVDNNETGLAFRVAERFVDSDIYNPSIDKTFSQETGLSEKYDINIYRDGEYMKSDGFCEEKLFEIAKNKSLLMALISGLNSSHQALRLKGVVEYREIDEEYREIDEEYKEIIDNSTHITIFPLYYLDPEERVMCKEKRYKKYWSEYRRELPRQTSVVIQFKDMRRNSVH